jgi:hypothetical protein
MTEAGDSHNCLWPLGTTEPWPTGFAQLMEAAGGRLGRRDSHN